MARKKCNGKRKEMKFSLQTNIGKEIPREAHVCATFPPRQANIEKRIKLSFPFLFFTFSPFLNPFSDPKEA